jgi:hypothetical protein
MIQYISLRAFWIFLFHSLLLGFFFGGLRDLFHLFNLPFGRQKRLFEKIWLFFSDFLYFLLVACFTSVFFFLENSGVIRIVSLLTIFIGGLIWRLTISRILTAIFRKWMKIMRKVIQKTLVPCFLKLTCQIDHWRRNRLYQIRLSQTERKCQKAFLWAKKE